MGTNKALIPIDGLAMARRVADTLVAVGCVPVIAYGGDPDELAALALAVIRDEHPGAGPVGGVVGLLELAGLRSAPVPHVFAVACDLPGLTPLAMAPMVSALREQPDADVVVARTSRIEPTCAIWNPAASDRIRQMFDAGERALHVVIEELSSVEVAVDAAALRNINTPEDLRRYS